MTKKILILDDDADILDMLSYFLSDNGYEVSTMLRGDKVLETIRSFHPDLILMDVMLANMDGRLICRNLKAESETRALPVILISGTHNLSESLNQQGAPDDFLAKPFDIEYLLHKIEFQLAA
ncbi:MAG TPA: response regulator [Mucilaginibacter sp.]|jgi:DNA-binding response OmpR family regulator|nr:response regulator [Mucilaginibacter sp.]